MKYNFDDPRDLEKYNAQSGLKDFKTWLESEIETGGYSGSTRAIMRGILDKFNEVCGE